VSSFSTSRNNSLQNNSENLQWNIERILREFHRTPGETCQTLKRLFFLPVNYNISKNLKGILKDLGRDPTQLAKHPRESIKS